MRHQRRRIWVSAALVPLAICSAATSALADVQLAFDPQNGIIEGVGTLAVDVTVDAEAADLRGFTFVVQFDATIVQVDSVTAGGLLLGAACPYFLYSTTGAGADSVQVDGATLGCSTAGPGSIATIHFRSLDQGPDGYPATTPLAWRSFVLRDSGNGPIAADGVPGSIQVNGPIAIETPGWSGVKARYRAPVNP